MLSRGSSWLVSSIALTLVVAYLMGLGGVSVSAQDELTPEENRAGRLGGTLDEVKQDNGEPDWVDAGLIGFNIVSLNNVDTILVVYHDSNEIVTKLSLVYLQQPTELEDDATLAAVVAEVAPRDGECEDEPLEESGLGTEVFACHSEFLEDFFIAQQLEALGVKGANGSYSYSVDPTIDDYFEIIVQFGTDSTTPVPTAVPTTAPSLTDLYPPVADVRELAIGRGYSEGDPLSISGTVQTIFVDGSYTQIQISVGAPDGSSEWVIVGYNDDSSGIFEGTWITVYGNYFGKECFTNTLGGEVCQPAILAVQIDR